MYIAVRTIYEWREANPKGWTDSPYEIDINLPMIDNGYSLYKAATLVAGTAMRMFNWMARVGIVRGIQGKLLGGPRSQVTQIFGAKNMQESKERTDRNQALQKRRMAEKEEHRKVFREFDEAKQAAAEAQRKQKQVTSS
jgi:hypothetical protein